ncbi:hydrogenase-4 subunit E [Leptospira sp. 96542]|nr:hydrogenase-4 subunit E [Leptospira sp. 96542]
MDKITGITNFNNRYINFVYKDNRIFIYPDDKKSNIDFLLDHNYPIWLLRHSFGNDMGEEDYSSFSEDIYLSDNRGKNLGLHQKSGVLRDLFYHGLKVPIKKSYYSHAVGPIHAGIIEPGHFRFVVDGEIIRHLTIRLGFQHRGIRNLINDQNPDRVLAISESISGDTSIGYALAFTKLYEEASKIVVSDTVQFFRNILLEIERIAVHIGDIGGIAEDIGYYPLHGVCLTDRGAALGLMETLTGSRFGKFAIRPGGVRLNQKMTIEQIFASFENLKKVFLQRIKPQIIRALENTTVRERLQGCGFISEADVGKYGFVGMVARMAGVNHDLRRSDVFYPNLNGLKLLEEHHNFNGDVWARFYLRYKEIEQSIEWVSSIWEKIDWDELLSKEQRERTFAKLNIKPGVYYSAIEAWRGSILICFEFNEMGYVKNSYIRDPSVLNWFALELAVRKELISDFPLNNKSFNLSYAGFDL